MDYLYLYSIPTDPRFLILSMLPTLPRPIIFAHRGASAHSPENTIASFTLAIRQGADALELDAKLTSDGHVVVFHDQSVDRVTSGSGLVKDMKLAALRELEAGSHFSPKFTGEPIPTLDEVFQTVGNQTYINIELTNYTSLFDDLPNRVAELVQRHNLEKRVLFSSFNPIALRKIHRILPEIPLGILARPARQGKTARGLLGKLLVPYQALHPHFSDTTIHLVKQLHRTGRRVHVWTVNQVEEMKRLIELDIDGIFTDDPILARTVINHKCDKDAQSS
jgi:glycerophosphoryl diester phosphodiesterase